MKLRNHRRKNEFLVLIERDEDGFLVASVPALKGCHTQAKTLPKLLERIKESIQLCLEVQKEPIKPLKFVGIQEIGV